MTDSALSLQIDLFLNYDCDLAAANLYERSIKGLSRVALGTDPLGRVFPGQQQDAAVRGIIASLRALDDWAGMSF